MTTKRKMKLVQEGEYVAEVEIDLLYTDNEWSPTISVADALKLDKVRAALKKGNIETASQLAQVYKLLPIAA